MWNALLLLCILIQLMRSNSYLNGTVSFVELSALQNLYTSTNGEDWAWRTPHAGAVWNFSVSNSTPCSPIWQGLKCICGTFAPCNITAISLDEYNLVGSIPNSIGNFTELSYLSLTANNLRGTIPISIWSLNHLQYLDLNTNYLRGSFLLGLNPTLKLETLSLGFNFLTGTIPPAIGDIDTLQELDLSGNYYTGSIPPSIGNLTLLTKLHLYESEFNGSIPSHVCSLHAVEELWLNGNDLTGTIPDCIGEMSGLVNLALQDNKLEGSIPESIQELNQTLNAMSLFLNHFTGSIPPYLFNGSLVLVLLDNNHFTGPLPTIVLPRLINFFAVNNHFSGSISDSLCESKVLRKIDLSYNLIEGSIPSHFGKLRVLDLAIFNYNQITGPLPESEKSLRPMSHYQFDTNQLTGTIPNSLCQTEVEYLDMGSNYFSGTVPNCFTRLAAFAINHNLLSGTLPSLNGSDVLQYFYAQANLFHGPVQLYANTSLSYVDVSNNQFSGPLPTDFFNPYVKLVSFAATSNCISGSIPEEICSVKSLVFLDLDGLATAKQCRSPVLPNIPAFKSFVLANEIEGGIPSCLFNMSNLQTLHLSGNSIQWSFPTDDKLEIGGNLTEMSLSHNKITGTIPMVIQSRQWSTLDLSFNKLVGTINFVEQESHNASLVLQVNRLSGGIPSSIVNMQSINVLTGNVFQCDLQRTGLPVHDTAHGTYQCGSNSFNQASIIWIVCASMMVLCLAMLWLYRSSWWEKIVKWCKETWEMLVQALMIFDEIDDPLYSFKMTLLALRRYVLVFTSILVVMFLPVYGTLTYYYKTVVYQYAWTVSAAFLSGVTPAMVLLALYLITIFLLTSIRSSSRRLDLVVNAIEPEKSSTYVQIACLLVMVVVNCAVMISVNGLYVFVILNYSTQIVFCAQISTALFKLLWNDFAVKGMLLLARRFYPRKDRNKERLVREEMPYMTFIILFNSIIAPCLATAAVDSNCFYNVFVAPSAVSSEFPYFNVVGNCDYQVGSVTGDTQCLQKTKESFVEVSYDPPFIYSYQCSSSMLTNYASVYVFMFLMVAFVKPVALYAMHKCYSKVPDKSCLFVMIDATMYRLLKPARMKDLERNKVLFHKDRFVLRMVAKVAVLITFGVIFPPLAVVVCFAFVSEIYLNLIIVGRFLTELTELTTRKRFRELLSRNCDGCMELMVTPVVTLVVPFAAIFYSFFVFDIYGDQVGFRHSVWASALLCALPILLKLGCTVNEWIKSRQRALDRKNTVTSGTEMTVNVLVVKDLDSEF